MKSFKKNLVRGIRSGIILSLFPLFSNYMFLTYGDGGDPYRWKDSFPIVRFSVNPVFSGVSNDDFKEAVEHAASLWFDSVGARFSLVFMDESTDQQPASFGSSSCSQDDTLEMKNYPRLVFSSDGPDPDCTALSCTFEWSCEGEKLHFDIQLNTHDFQWSNDANDTTFHIQTILLHEFGHVAGLTHCAAGDTAASCRGVTGSNPETSSVMNRFLTTLDHMDQPSVDDSSGLVALYGKFSSPYPLTGDYKITADEIQAIGIVMSEQHEGGLDTPEMRQVQAQELKKTIDFIDSGMVNETLEYSPIPGYTAGMSAIDYGNAMKDLQIAHLSERNDLQLRAMLMAVSPGPVILQDLMDQYSENSSTPSRNMLQSFNSINIDLRKAILDEMRARE